MKTYGKQFCGLMIFCLPFLSSADGFIVPNGVVSNYYGFSISQHEISVLYDPLGLNYTGFILQPQAAPNSFLFAPVVDVGVRVFFVSPNAPITEAAILANQFPELQPANVYSLTTPFYVGLYTGADPTNPQPGGIYNDPLFGWAHLANVNGTIQILDSALAYQAGGIFAGTHNLIPVPEPAVFAFASLAAFLLALTRWRKHTTT